MGRHADPGRALGRRCARGSRRTGCATRCSSRSRRRRRSPRSPAATSASSRRCPTCSSARRCPASSCRSTPHSCASSRRAGCGPREVRDAIKRAEGSVQGVAALPAGRARAVPHRVGAAAAGADRPGRGARAVHRPVPVAEPVHRARRRSASSPRCTCTPGRPGLKTTYYLRSRPATRIQQATVAVAPRGRRPVGHRAADVDARRSPAPWRTPRPARRASDHHLGPRMPRMLLDPGMDLTLRPMRYPHFYDRFRDAIKNTWTVEEVDLHSDLADLAAAQRRRAAPGQPAGRVLRHRRHDRRQQPGAEPVPARQLPRGPALPVPAAVRGGRARPVLPDPARHLRPRRAASGTRRSPRSRTSRRSRRKAEFCFRWIDSVFDLDELRDRATTGGRSCST